MIQLTTRERVDSYWSQTLDVDVAVLHSPGVHAHQNPPDRILWRGIYVLAFDKAACVFAPPDLLGAVRGWVADMDAESALSPQAWTAHLPDTRTVAYGPAVHYYLDDRAALTDLAAGRRINPRDAAALAQLRGAVATDEWTTAGFTAQSAILFGLFDGERLVAAANLTPGPDAATDVGIAVHPAERHHGYGLRIAATAARQAIAMHGVARFRAPVANPGMQAMAARMGCTEYGRNLVLYLAG